MLGRKQKENYVGGGEVSLLCHSRLRVKKGKKSNQPNPNESSPQQLLCQASRPEPGPVRADGRGGCSTAPAAGSLPSLLLLQGFIS